MTNMAPYILLYLFNVFLAAISQVMLKKAALQHYSSVIKEYFNPLVIGAYGVFFITTILNLVALRVLPVSMGPVLEATSYLYITFFGVRFFGEKVTKRQLFALIIIILGIFVFSFLG